MTLLMRSWSWSDVATDAENIKRKQGGFARLLADTLAAAHPALSEVSEATRERFKNEWLEGLERHTTGLIGDLVDRLTADGEPPEEIATLLAKIKDPSAQFGSLVQQFFVYGLVFQLAGVMLAPFSQQVQNSIWQAHPDRPLSPPDIATGVIRGIQRGTVSDVPIPDWASKEAGKSGISAEDMQFLADITGSPPDATSLFEMIRRGIIDESQLTEALKQSDLRDQWIPYFAKLRYITPTPADLVRSAVQNQITYDEAAKLAAELGLEPPNYISGNPDWFHLLYSTYGRPPGPQEMGRAANRGLTDWDSTGPESISFTQAISESDIKDKYIPLLRKLAVYYPPNGEIRTLLMHGGITEAQAKSLWMANGVPAEIADAYLHLAQVEQITQDKAIAKGDILTLVREEAISDEQAAKLLGFIGYSGDNAATLIRMAHYQYELEVLRRTVTRIGTLYTSFKITSSEAQTAFEAAGLPDTQIHKLMDTLTVERAAQAPTLTASQVSGALYYGVITQEDAMRRLESLGYAPDLAWIVLSDRMHGPLPNPPAGIAPPGQNPTPAGA